MRRGRALGAWAECAGVEALYRAYSASNPLRSGVTTSVWTRHLFLGGPLGFCPLTARADVLATSAFCARTTRFLPLLPYQLPVLWLQ